MDIVPLSCHVVHLKLPNTARATHSRYYEHFAKQVCDFALILLEFPILIYYACNAN